MVNFDAAPNKTATIRLDTNAKLESRSTLNVAFSTADQDTAILKFIVTQDNKPLYLGEANIESNIYLKHSNGSHISHPLTITDGLNGELAFKLPNDFGKIPGQVTAQVYVARKGEKQAIVAERIFSFTIQKSLAWEFEAETKLAYIIEFNELRERIVNRQKEIEDAMANAEDYVTQLEQAREKGLSDIEIAKTSSLEELNNLADTRLQEINTTGTQYIDDLTTVRDGIDGKIDQFNNDVQAKGYIKDEDTAKWQKYKLTTDNGILKNVMKVDFNEPENTLGNGGIFYGMQCINQPQGEQSFGNVIYQKRDAVNSSHEKIYFTPYNNNNQYIRTKTIGVWGKWQVIGPSKDTGWLPLTLKNSYKNSTTPDFEPSYRVVDHGGYKQVYVRLGVENITNGKNVVATIPKEFAPNKIYSLGVSTNVKIPPKVIISGGDIEFHTNEADNYATTDYIIYQDSWIV